MIEKIMNKYDKVNQSIISKLETFELPIFQDTVHSDERPEKLNLFMIVFGNWNTVDDQSRQIQQDVYITYLSEDRDDVDKVVIKVVNEIQKIDLMKFESSDADYVQKSGTEEYVDRVIMHFKRGVGRLDC